MNKLDNIRIKCSTKAMEVTAEGLLVEEEGVEKMLAADTVIYAIGQKPYREEAPGFLNALLNSIRLVTVLRPEIFILPLPKHIRQRQISADFKPTQVSVVFKLDLKHFKCYKNYNC